MSCPSSTSDTETPPTRERRPYNSPLRRQKAADTRTRILTAGSELVHSFPTWDWGTLTFGAVAARSGVSIRTVFRHFNTEVELRRAVMHRLEEEAGVLYEGLELDDLPTITERVFAVLPSFAVPPSEGPGRFPEEDGRRRQALVAAVKTVAADWSAPQVNMAAAILDVMWSPVTYERLTTAWDLRPHDATEAVTWVIKLVTMAISDDQGPSATPPPPLQPMQAQTPRL